MRARRFADAPVPTIDNKQFAAAILYAHIQRLEAASKPEWDPETRSCGSKIERIQEVIMAITFCESQFADGLCDAADIDKGSYFKRAKELFLQLDREIQARALRGAEEWWEQNAG